MIIRSLRFRFLFLGMLGVQLGLDRRRARIPTDCVTLTRSLAATTRMTRSSWCPPLGAWSAHEDMTQGLSRPLLISLRRTGVFAYDHKPASLSMTRLIVSPMR